MTSMAANDETNAQDRLVVRVGSTAYPIVMAGEGEDVGVFAREVLGGGGRHRALMVSDTNLRRIARGVRERLEAAGFDCLDGEVPAGEASKSLEQAWRLWDLLVEARADRRTLVVGVGGGVVGDLAGFVAATYARGVPLLMVPTSLLAQVDSSVGGKVAINHPGAKNIIGAFHQPVGVWIDARYLTSLPDREYRSGLAEVVKYGVILDPDFLAWQEREAGAILGREEAIIARLVRRCCELKAEVVAADEREETGLRAILNFGHTIGHAVESVLGYKYGMLHGEAVSIGMVRECRLAERLGWIEPELTGRITSLLGRLGLPTALPELPERALLDAMGRDKKNVGGSIRFVLPKGGAGRMESSGEVSIDMVRSVLVPGE